MNVFLLFQIYLKSKANPKLSSLALSKTFFISSADIFVMTKSVPTYSSDRVNCFYWT